MQHHHSNTADPQPSHLTANEVQKLAADAGAQSFHFGQRILIRRGSFAESFDATADALYRAAPIRSWLGV